MAPLDGAVKTNQKIGLQQRAIVTSLNSALDCAN